MKTKIWFNHWFNSAYHFINLIKNNPDKIEYEFFGTSSNTNSIVLQACDQIDMEPDVKGDGYVDYCLDFCKKHKIDIFIPRRGQLDIVKSMKEFSQIDTRVLALPEVETLGILSDKEQLYESCKKHGIIKLPEYKVVNTVREFMEAYSELTGCGCRVCFKPVRGEGGAGFRIVDDKPSTLESLYNYISLKVPIDEVYRLLSSKESFDSLMVSEYLDGFEYSIDCLAWQGKLLAAVPRKKVDGRIRVLEDSQELIEISRKLTEIYNLSYVYNIQVRYREGVPKLLEINPRMSGGLHISCLSGVNFPYYAVKLLSRGECEVPVPKLGIKAYQIEQGIEMKDVNEGF